MQCNRLASSSLPIRKAFLTTKKFSQQAFFFPPSTVSLRLCCMPINWESHISFRNFRQVYTAVTAVFKRFRTWEYLNSEVFQNRLIFTIINHSKAYYNANKPLMWHTLGNSCWISTKHDCIQDTMCIHPNSLSNTVKLTNRVHDQICVVLYWCRTGHKGEMAENKSQPCQVRHETDLTQFPVSVREAAGA